MSEYTLYHNPRSRGQIARWALHEAGADYETVLVDFSGKPAALLQANAMGKVPTLIHHGADGDDRVVTEAPAICVYLAEMNPEMDLQPFEDEMADYYRWMFFAAGPLEHAITNKALGFEMPIERQGMVGYGTPQKTIAALEGHLADRAWVCGDRFTMADVYVGSHVDWGLNFGTLPPSPAFVAYAERLQARPAYIEAKAIDAKLIAERKQ